jgi:hypothetical protein
MKVIAMKITYIIAFFSVNLQIIKIFFSSARIHRKMMSQKSVKRKIQWKIENVTREKLEDKNFQLNSNEFVLKLRDNVTKW